MGEDDLIRRGDALRAIDPGHGDFHAGNYNAIAALPVVDKDATIARLTAELAEARAERDALIGAAYEAAARARPTYGLRDPDDAYGVNTVVYVLQDAIRALIPATSTATLDRIKAEAELAGWKRGRDDALSAFDKVLYSPAKEGAQTRHFRKTLTPPADLAARIAKEAGNE